MQHSPTNNRHPNDHALYHQQAEETPLYSLVEFFSEKIKNTSSAVFSWAKAASSSLTNMTKRCRCQINTACSCPSKKKKVSKVTRQLIREINSGFDPLDLSLGRWTADSAREDKQENQRVEEIKQSYSRYLNSNRGESRLREKFCKKIKIEKENSQQIQEDLWSIAGQNLRISKKKVEEWKSSGGKPSDSKLQLTELPLPQKEGKDMISHPNYFKSPQQQNITQQVSEISVKASNQLTINQKKDNEVPQIDAAQKQVGQLQTNPNQEKQKSGGKAKLNPFLSSSANKKMNLMDLIVQNSSSNIFSQSKSQTNNDRREQVFSRLNASDESNTSHPQPSHSPFQTMFNSQQKRETIVTQPNNTPLSTFGSNFTRNLKNSIIPSQLSSNQHVRSGPQSDIFSGISSKSSEGHKIIEMFSSKPKKEISLFQDTRSEKTERKVQGHTNRRASKKNAHLRVS